MTIIPESHSDILETKALAHIATIGPQGEPQNNPVWFDWDGQYLLFSQTKGRQKYHNLERDPRVAISIVDPENPYRYLEIRGRLVRVDEDPNLDFINRMAKKYMGKDKYPWHQPTDERVVMVVEPEHTTTMGNAKS
ncbi:MAG: PPOX class F420-dependent oxidoreductase [Chloroflexota bacterium]|nr:PPOX class F420-dependent oxidoreductase [Chloroflexota bacterium]